MGKVSGSPRLSFWEAPPPPASPAEPAAPACPDEPPESAPASGAAPPDPLEPLVSESSLPHATSSGGTTGKRQRNLIAAPSNSGCTKPDSAENIGWSIVVPARTARFVRKVRCIERKDPPVFHWVIRRRMGSSCFADTHFMQGWATSRVPTGTGTRKRSLG